MSEILVVIGVIVLLILCVAQPRIRGMCESGHDVAWIRRADGAQERGFLDAARRRSYVLGCARCRYQLSNVPEHIATTAPRLYHVRER